MLQGRVAIVSGIGPGMGRDVSLALAREGADLVLAARPASKLAEVAEEVRAAGRRALEVPADITRVDDCRRVAAQAQEAFGRADVLVNNAFDMGAFVRMEDATAEDLLRPLRVNLIGSLQLTHEVLPLMKAQRRGSIVMINSMIVRDVLPSMGPYGASKAALLAATQGLAREMGPHGIRVNSVVPGYIWGESLRGYFAQQAKQRGVDPQTVYDEVAAQTALRHLPTSEEIADAVVFFASDLSRVVTGQSLDVNGGHVFH
ncbi:MAG: short-chain dehydrogenase [Proteobacteria bacterium]|nr:MAG: short-chain dehydrogenase [Pseudomonadota bacterium]